VRCAVVPGRLQLYDSGRGMCPTYDPLRSVNFRSSSMRVPSIFGVFFLLLIALASGETSLAMTMNVISPVTDAYSKLHIGLEGEIAPGDDAHLQKLLRNRNANGVHIDLEATLEPQLQSVDCFDVPRPPFQPEIALVFVFSFLLVPSTALFS